MRLRIVFLSVLCCALGVRTAGAAVRFVSWTGSDPGNDCLSSAAPCQTLHRAENEAAAGDEIDLTAGLYDTDLTTQLFFPLTVSGGWASDFASRDPHAHRTRLGNLRVENLGGPTFDVTLDGLAFRAATNRGGGISAFGPLNLTVNECRFEGTNIVADQLNLMMTRTTFTRYPAVYPAALVLGAAGAYTTSATVQSSEFTSNKTSGIAVSASDPGGMVSLSIDRSIFKSNKAAGGGALFVQGGSGSVDVTVTNSVMLRNKAQIRPLGNGSGGAVAVIGGTGSTTVALVSDTIVANQASNKSGPGGRGGGVFVTGNATVNLTDDVLWHDRANGSGSDLDVASGATVNADHDDVGTALGGINDLGGNVSVDPELVRGFDLKSGSPLIDTGTCTGAPATDIEGDPRPTGAGCDVGADEFVP